MVTTHSEEEWQLLRSLRNQGRADSGGWLEHARLGFNYRIDDIRRGDRARAAREARRDPRARGATVAERYGELLARCSTASRLPCADDADHERSWFVYVVALPPGLDREAVIASSRRAACRRRAICRASTCSRTCGSASASAPACARSPRMLSRADARAPVPRARCEDDQRRRGGAPLGALVTSKPAQAERSHLGLVREQIVRRG